MENDLGYNVLLYEFKAALNAYLGKTPATNPIRTLSDIIDFNNEHAEETLKFGQVMLEKVERTSGTLTERAYIEALLRNRHLAGDIALGKALDEHDYSSTSISARSWMQFRGGSGLSICYCSSGLFRGR